MSSGARRRALAHFRFDMLLLASPLFDAAQPVEILPGRPSSRPLPRPRKAARSPSGRSAAEQPACGPRPNIRVTRGHFEIVLFVPTGCANVRLIITIYGHGSTTDFSLQNPVAKSLSTAMGICKRQLGLSALSGHRYPASWTEDERAAAGVVVLISATLAGVYDAPATLTWSQANPKVHGRAWKTATQRRPRTSIHDLQPMQAPDRVARYEATGRRRGEA
jgi:hypothetical protein